MSRLFVLSASDNPLTALEVAQETAPATFIEGGDVRTISREALIKCEH